MFRRIADFFRRIAKFVERGERLHGLCVQLEILESVGVENDDTEQSKLADQNKARILQEIKDLSNDQPH